MTNTKMIEDYLMWKRGKDLYPPKFSPEEWAKELLMSEASARLNMLKDFLEQDLDIDEPIDSINKIHSIAYEPLEDLFAIKEGESDDQLSVGASGEA